MKWLLLLVFFYFILNKLRPSSNDLRLKREPSKSSVQRLKTRTKNNVNIKLSDEQQSLYRTIESSNQHFFISGKAGTGKSVLLKHFAASTKKQIVVVAPTGVAAMNVKGQTIHSLFRFNPGLIEPNKIKLIDQTKQLLHVVDAIVIDEISMVRADMIDGIDRMLRLAKNRKEPFGGVQIIAFGDMYQLPPVVETAELRKYFSDTYDGPYFFKAKVWQNTVLHNHELKTVFRQSNKRFKEILDAIRQGSPSQQDFEILRQRIVTQKDLPAGDYVTLTSSNAAARKINDTHLNNLQTKSKTYSAKIVGSIASNSFPTEGQLVLRVGAQVIFIKNDPSNRWVNGTIGTVLRLLSESVIIQCGSRQYEVFPTSWEKSTYTYNEEADTIEQKVTCTFTQLPLKLAWAITIHKSQGCSYRKVAIDLRDGAFAHGQTYVALSRCRTLEGIFLLGEVRQSDIIVDPTIVDFMKHSNYGGSAI